MQSRRSFLRSGVMTALSAGLAVGAGRLAFGQQVNAGAPQSNSFDFAIPSQASQETLFYYDQAAFESYLGSTFTTRGASGRTIELTLVRVAGFAPHSKARILTTEARASKSFMLSFDASGPLPVFTTIHTLHHDALGDIDLFVTERKTESGALFYDAVINHDGPLPSAPRTPVYHIEESPRMPAPDPVSTPEIVTGRGVATESGVLRPKPDVQRPTSFRLNRN